MRFRNLLVFGLVASIAFTGPGSLGSLDLPAQTTSGGQAGPTLTDTISFMNDSMSSEDGYVSSANKCELYFTRNRLYTFAVPLGQRSENGISSMYAHGLKWLVMAEPAQIARFHLESINPKSINSRAVWSVPTLKAPGRYVEPLPSADLVLVMFDTSHSTSSIELGHFKRSATTGTTEAVFGESKSSAFVVFESKLRAEKFVTAFVHAVDLCGGTGVDFAPTPSEQGEF